MKQDHRHVYKILLPFSYKQYKNMSFLQILNFIYNSITICTEQ